MLVGTQDDRANGIPLEVERETESVVREFEHLALHGVGQTVDARDAIGQRHDGALRAYFRAGIEVLNPALDQLTDFRRVQLHGFSLRCPRHCRGVTLRSRSTP